MKEIRPWCLLFTPKPGLAGGPCRPSCRTDHKHLAPREALVLCNICKKKLGHGKFYYYNTETKIYVHRSCATALTPKDFWSGC